MEETEIRSELVKQDSQYREQTLRDERIQCRNSYPIIRNQSSALAYTGLRPAADISSSVPVDSKSSCVDMQAHWVRSLALSVGARMWMDGTHEFVWQ